MQSEEPLAVPFTLQLFSHFSAGEDLRRKKEVAERSCGWDSEGLSWIPLGGVCVVPSRQCFPGQVAWLSMLSLLGVHLGCVRMSRGGSGVPGQQ